MAKLDPLNTSRYWHAPDLPGMDLLHADFRTHEYAPHVHYSFVIAVTEAGGSEFTSRGRTGIAQPRSLLVFNRAEPHSGRMAGSERWRYRSFYLADAGIRHLMTSLGQVQARYFASNAIDDPQLSHVGPVHVVVERDAAHDAGDATAAVVGEAIHTIR